MIKPATLLYTVLLSVLLACASMASANSVIGWPGFDPGKWSDSGLYVWQDWQGGMHLRLVGGNRNHEFKGTIWTSRPIWSMGGVSLEWNDTVKRKNAQAIEFHLRVGGRDQDGFDITLPADAGVCIFGWGTLGNAVMLGAERAKVETEVDLRGTGACNGGGNVPPGVASNGGDDGGGWSGGNGSTDTGSWTGSTSKGLKYNPGHYIAMTAWDGRGTMIEAATRPGVKGVHKRYQWRHLERGQDSYDFSAIQQDLQLLADHGKQLVVIIEDKTFNDGNPLPPYLSNRAVRNMGGGWTALRWDPWVVQRLAALTRAMGQRFDSHPNFEGVAIQESAPSLADRVLGSNGYTPEKYRDALIQMLLNARSHFPTSQVFWYMNYVPRNQGYIRQIANRVAQAKVAMGGPDVLPDDATLASMAYPFYREFKGRMTLFASMQYDSYSHRRKGGGKYWTMPELFRYARDSLHANYIFWTRQPTAQPWGSWSWTDALPVIRSNPSFNQ